MVVGMILVMPFLGAENLMNAMSAASLNSPGGILLLKYFQVVQSIGLFVAPPFAIGLLYHGNIWEYLKIDRSAKAQSFLLASVCLLITIPAINFLGDLNSKMSLPGAFSGLENWMRNMEEGAKELTEKFMAVDGIPGLIFNVFMIAVLPALGEELMFRGVFQRIFSNWAKNHHWGIWITAFLFSAMHMQFYGFLPRMLLGAMFGYLLVWTGTMWVPILAHFVNNLLGVIGYFLIGKGIISEEVEEWGTGSGQIFLVIISLLTTGGLLYFIYKGEQHKTKMPVNRTDSQA
jgi:membrane protease YdiL (CAAX protease family)